MNQFDQQLFIAAFWAMRRLRQLLENEVTAHVGFSQTPVQAICEATGKSHSAVAMALKPFLEQGFILAARHEGRICVRLDQQNRADVVVWQACYCGWLPGEIEAAFEVLRLKTHGLVYAACLAENGGTIESICRQTGLTRPAVHAAIRRLVSVGCLVASEKKVIRLDGDGMKRTAFTSNRAFLNMTRDFAPILEKIRITAAANRFRKPRVEFVVDGSDVIGGLDDCKAQLSDYFQEIVDFCERKGLSPKTEKAFAIAARIKNEGIK